MLKEDYKNDIMPEGDQRRKYKIIANDDGTVYLEDVTDYISKGDDFKAADINATNHKINELDGYFGKPILTSSPSSISTPPSKYVTFNANYFSVLGKDIKYQWYYKTSADGSWIATGGVKTEPSLRIYPSASWDGRIYRCAAYYPGGEMVYSGEALLTVVS